MKQCFPKVLIGMNQRKNIAVLCAALIGTASVLPFAGCEQTDQSSQALPVSSQTVSQPDASTLQQASELPSSAGSENGSAGSSAAQAAYGDIDVTGKTLCGSFGTVVCGSLKSDPKQGVAVVLWNGKSSNAEPKRYLTPEKHGAIKADVSNTAKSAKEDVFHVAATDGYTWLFNLYNGFESGRQSASGAKPASSKAPAVTGKVGSGQAPKAGECVVYEDKKSGTSLRIRKKDGTGDRVIATDYDEAACLAGDWVYYFADLDTVRKVKTDGSQRTTVCNTDAIGELNGSTEVTTEYQNGSILIRTLQLKSAGDTGPSASPHYYRLDLGKNKITPVKK